MHRSRLLCIRNSSNSMTASSLSQPPSSSLSSCLESNFTKRHAHTLSEWISICREMVAPSGRKIANSFASISKIENTKAKIKVQKGMSDRKRKVEKKHQLRVGVGVVHRWNGGTLHVVDANKRKKNEENKPRWRSVFTRRATHKRSTSYPQIHKGHAAWCVSRAHACNPLNKQTQHINTHYTTISFQLSSPCIVATVSLSRALPIHLSSPSVCAARACRSLLLHLTSHFPSSNISFFPLLCSALLLLLLRLLLLRLRPMLLLLFVIILLTLTRFMRIIWI